MYNKTSIRPNDVTFKNAHYVFLFTLKVSRFFLILIKKKTKTKNKKQNKQPYIKIPSQHYTTGRSLQPKMAIFYWKSTKVFPDLICIDAVL